VTRAIHSRRRRGRAQHAAAVVLLVAGAALLLTAVSLASETQEVVGAHLDIAPSGAVDTHPPSRGYEPPAEPLPTPPDPADRAVPTAPVLPAPVAEHELAPELRSDEPDAAPPEPIEQAARPETVAIPRIDVHADLIGLDLDADRRLEVPTDPQVPGWFVRGPRPGEDGAAIVAGHVDSQRGPAIFWRIPELEPGDEVIVHREDGSEVVFVVDRVGRWPKDEFPTDEVYRRSAGPELRLITCGGIFDEDARSYRDNIIVFATATS
jgi:sortase (surface protein transpeptidase)